MAGAMDENQLAIEESSLSQEQRATLLEAMNKGLLGEQFCQLVMLDDGEDGEEPSFLSEVSEQYLSDATEHMTKLREMVGDGTKEVDWVALDALAHRFKGSSCNMGALNVTACLVKLRDLGKVKDLEGSREMVEKADEAVVELRPALEAFVAKK